MIDNKLEVFKIFFKSVFLINAFMVIDVLGNRLGKDITIFDLNYFLKKLKLFGIIFIIYFGVEYNEEIFNFIRCCS